MFVQNQILNGTYQILQPIGSGGSSSVYLAYHVRLQKYVVIKKLKGENAQGFLLRTEVDTLKNLHHPNLPQVYDFIQEQGQVYTVIDYVNGQDLESYIRSGYRFTEEQLKRYLRQIVDVLAYLHSREPAIIHSDIKPGNIIINQEGNAILIDFNTSVGQNKGNLLGLTLQYASPEQLRMAQELAYSQNTSLVLDPRSDLYSLGATFYELICGIRLKPGVSPKPLCTMGLNQYSQSFLMLIDKMLQYDREKRIKSAKRLASALDRMDSRFLAYFTLRCASVLLCALMIGAGIYCCIMGSRLSVQEQFQSRYSIAQKYISEGYLDSAQQICDEILADGKLNNYLQNNPQALAQYYHALGDVAYYSENYTTAMAYYDYAVEQCDGTDRTMLTTYLRDAAIASAQAGKLQQAQEKLEIVKTYHSGGDDLKLIEIVLQARQGNVEKSLELTQQLLDSCKQTDICARATLCAASVAPDIDSQIRWLKKACSYDSGRSATRGLAAAYTEKAQNSSGSEKTAALKEACAIYEALNQSEYASSQDRMNYATVLRMQDKVQKAILVLEKALQYDPNNYLLLMNLCFACHEQGSTAKAANYCKNAISAWRNNTSQDKLSENSEQIQNLLELARRYGIGGKS